MNPKTSYTLTTLSDQTSSRKAQTRKKNQIANIRGKEEKMAKKTNLILRNRKIRPAQEAHKEELKMEKWEQGPMKQENEKQNKNKN